MDRTMKITETDNSTTVEGEGVEILREGKDYYFDTETARVFLDQLFMPYEGERVSLRLHIELPREPEKKADAKK